MRETQLAPKSLDDSTVNKMRNAIELWCKKKGKFEQLMMFDFMVSCGPRVGEVTKLRFQNVIFEVDEDRQECAYMLKVRVIKIGTCICLMAFWQITSVS